MAPPTIEAKVRTVKLGSLHVRLSNIGRSTRNTNTIESLKPKSNNQVLVHDYHEHIKHRLPTEIVSKKMVEIDSELKDLLQNTYIERVQLRKAMESNPQETTPINEDVRLLHRAFKHMKEDNIVVPEEWLLGGIDDDTYAYKRSRQERKKDLETLQIYRERHKHSTIQNILKQQLTATQKIDVSLGQGYFFEFVFKNPYSEDHNYEIFWEDSELRIITSDNEWLYHRRRNNVFENIETNMITPIVDGRAQIFLSANEEIHIPFIFQTFSSSYADHTMEEQNTKLEQKRSLSKVVHVSFLNAKRTPVAFLNVLVSYMNFFIDKSLQMFHHENEMVRKTIRHQFHGTSQMTNDGITSLQSENLSVEKYLKCSHLDVVCSLNNSVILHSCSVILNTERYPSSIELEMHLITTISILFFSMINTVLLFLKFGKCAYTLCFVWMSMLYLVRPITLH
jgi:nephrocystin-4